MMKLFSKEIMLLFVALIVLFIVIFYILKTNGKKGRISEWSYQRYARFYGNTILHDEYFENKINAIYDLVVNKGEADLFKIAEETGCLYEECILKIKYLKNKRKIGDLYIDEINGIISKCSEEDKRLLDKYRKYIYYNHYQIDEIATNLPNATLENKKKLEEEVFNDLIYLDSKGLLNGILINEVDRKIVYYTIEKHKKEKDFITVNCQTCGALNDVNRGGKARCEYCKSIVEGEKK